MPEPFIADRSESTTECHSLTIHKKSSVTRYSNIIFMQFYVNSKTWREKKRFCASWCLAMRKVSFYIQRRWGHSFYYGGGCVEFLSCCTKQLEIVFEIIMNHRLQLFSLKMHCIKNPDPHRKMSIKGFSATNIIYPIIWFCCEDTKRLHI